MESSAQTWHAAKTCRVCGKPLSLHEGFAGQLCGRWKCRWIHLDRQLEEYREVAARALGVEAPESYKRVTVPAWGRSTAPLSSERRRAFRGRVAELVDEARQRPADVPSGGGAPRSLQDASEPGPGGAILSKVCAVCEGVCCYDGRDAAFQDVETVGRFLSAQPGMAAEAAISAYLSFLPEHGYETSCVYHTTRGCVLPRTMWAPICLAYECRGLKDLREHVFDTGQRRGFVVVRDDGRIIRGAFIDDSGTRHSPPREHPEHRMERSSSDDRLGVGPGMAPLQPL